MPDDAMIEKVALLPVADVRKEVVRLMREEFDPTPPRWEGSDWNDNAEDVADKIAALFAAPPSAATIRAEDDEFLMIVVEMLRDSRSNAESRFNAASKLDALRKRLIAEPTDER